MFDVSPRMSTFEAICGLMYSTGKVSEDNEFPMASTVAGGLLDYHPLKASQAGHLTWSQQKEPFGCVWKCWVNVPNEIAI